MSEPTHGPHPRAASAGALARIEVIARLRSAGCVRAEDEADLLLAAAGEADRLTALVSRRVAGEPLEHVLGWARFEGIRVRVSPGVFVPRARSAPLVASAAALLAGQPEAAGTAAPPVPGRPVVVDLCAGTGALGLALAARATTRIELHAADVDPVAVADATVNLAAVGGRAHLGDLFDALPAALRGRVHLILCNAPYVPTEGIALMPHEAREHEARVALDGGPDGLEVHRRVLAQATDWLAPGGAVLVEVHDEQVAALDAAARAAGLTTRAVRDPQERTTVVVASRPGPAPATRR